ncbi:hypothetical protein K457DRAFT_120661 [Linnemannia elongata AG-77]|uniref:Uncharacterized protein n=1 Tax=Linnemannia elongata AG-77 TaxID=1314771 RepID=A0A197KHT1_9FUNG|nr:hypothetical protein K457DRAFT_120661 [Linnemannia elongata AG-77]
MFSRFVILFPLLFVSSGPLFLHLSFSTPSGSHRFNLFNLQRPNKNLISSTCTSHVKEITSNLAPRQQPRLFSACTKAKQDLQPFSAVQLRVQGQAVPKLQYDSSSPLN